MISPSVHAVDLVFGGFDIEVPDDYLADPPADEHADWDGSSDPADPLNR